MKAYLSSAIFFVVLSSGCGDGVEACEAYNTAHTDCYETVGMEPEFLVDCEEIPKEMIKRYECLADLYNNAECLGSDTMPSQEEAEACP